MGGDIMVDPPGPGIFLGGAGTENDRACEQ